MTETHRTIDPLERPDIITGRYTLSLSFDETRVLRKLRKLKESDPDGYRRLVRMIDADFQIVSR
jgi:hypothetical protein